MISKMTSKKAPVSRIFFLRGENSSEMKEAGGSVGGGEGKGPRDEGKGQVLHTRRETAKRFHPVTQMDGPHGKWGAAPAPYCGGGRSPTSRPHGGWRWGM